MQRYTFTLDDNIAGLLSGLADRYYGGNKSLTIRAALESLAAHVGHEGWVIAGYTPIVIEEQSECFTCHESHGKGDILYRPVFERGSGEKAIPNLPAQVWLACSNCAEKV